MRKYIIGYHIMNYPSCDTRPLEITNIKLDSRQEYTVYGATRKREVFKWNNYFMMGGRSVTIEFKKFPGLYRSNGHIVDGCKYPSERLELVRSEDIVKKILQFNTVSAETIAFYRKQGF